MKLRFRRRFVGEEGYLRLREVDLAAIGENIKKARNKFGLTQDDNPATKAFKKAIFEQGIPLTQFAVENTQKEYERLKKLGVKFTMEPTRMGSTIIAVFDDTCGNVIQLVQY